MLEYWIHTEAFALMSKERKMFAGLPELGISNGEDLKETLTNCTEPLKAIDQFQVHAVCLPEHYCKLQINVTVSHML